MPPEQVQYYFQLSQLQQNAASGSSSQAQIAHLPPGAHIIQQNGQVIIAAQPHQIAALAGAAANVSFLIYCTAIYGEFFFFMTIFIFTESNWYSSDPPRRAARSTTTSK